MPAGLAIGLGALGMIVAAFIAALVPVDDPGGRFAVMAVAVGLFAALSLDQLALAVVAVIAALVTNGFLEDQSGQLRWHADDRWRLLILIMVGVVGFALGESVRYVRELRRG